VTKQSFSSVSLAMTQGAIVLPVVTRGRMEASAIRRSTPYTLSMLSTTDIASRCPFLQCRTDASAYRARRERIAPVPLRSEGREPLRVP
jgi:hypothetical protein